MNEAGNPPAGIAHRALRDCVGAASPQLQTDAEMVKAIRETGRTPLQQGTFYEPIKVFADGHQPAATEPEPSAGKSKVLEGNRVTA